MAQPLEQAEIDALMHAVESGAVAPPLAGARVFSRSRRRGGDVEIRPYDFKRPERVSKDQMRALQTLHEAFARSFGASLSAFLRMIVEVKLATCEQMTYGEFVAGLPIPTSFNLIDPEPLEGQICLDLSPLIIYPVIDRLLGGTNEELFIPQRPQTLIEQRLISKVIGRALTALEESWAGVREIKFKLKETESNPQLVQIVPPNEVVIVVGFEIKMANRAGTMNLCIPYTVIEPLMEGVAAQTWFSTRGLKKSQETERTISARLNRAALDLECVLAETTIALGDLLSLAPGDLITTDKPASEPATLLVEGRRKFTCRVGELKGSRAVKVMRPVGPKDRA